MRGIIQCISFLVFLVSCAHNTAQTGMNYCPSPELLSSAGVPAEFEFVQNSALQEKDHTLVYGFDTARLDQQSAEILNGNSASGKFLNCLYDANSFDSETGTMPFYIIRTKPSAGQMVHVNFSEVQGRGWGGFCFAPSDAQSGCVVVCHVDEARCPFTYVK